jgi:hypothetical protein
MGRGHRRELLPYPWFILEYGLGDIDHSIPVSRHTFDDMFFSMGSLYWLGKCFSFDE